MKLVLKEVRLETADVSTFIFTPDTPVSYKAGQHMSMQLPHENPDMRGIVRTFTISSSPTQEGILTITTKKGPSSFKQALYALRVGATVEARGPGGMFYLKEEDPRHVFLAGGIGITPFHSMIRYASDKQLNCALMLLYSNKTPNEIVFKDELDELVKRSANLRVVYTMTQTDPSGLWQGRVGRIDEALLGETGKTMTNAHWYASGPPLFVDAMLGALKIVGIDGDHTHFERFSGYTP